MQISNNTSIFFESRTIILSAMLTLMTAALAFQSIPLQGIFIASCFAVLIVYSAAIDRLAWGETEYLALLIASCVIVLPINVFRTPPAALHFVMILAAISGGIFSSRNTKAYVAASFVVLTLAQILVVIFILTHRIDFPLEEIIPDTSSNGITSYLVCLQVNYCIANFYVRRRTSPVTALITLYICVVGYGRGSIIASLAIFLICLVFLFRSWRPSYSIPATAVLSILVSFIAIRYYSAIFDYAVNSTKLGTGLFDEPRAAMNAQYWNGMTGLRLLLGYNYDGMLIERFYNGNPHNSYIRAHHIFGLLYVLLVTAMAARPLFTNLPAVEKLFHLSMFGILLLRVSTEPVLFATPFDLIYMSLFLMFGRPDGGTARGPQNWREKPAGLVTTHG